MSLEAWGDENPAANDPTRDCPDCDGSGEIQWIEDDLLHVRACTRCDGTGCVPDEYEPLEDDML